MDPRSSSGHALAKELLWLKIADSIEDETIVFDPLKAHTAKTDAGDIIRVAVRRAVPDTPGVDRRRPSHQVQEDMRPPVRIEPDRQLVREVADGLAVWRTRCSQRSPERCTGRSEQQLYAASRFLPRGGHNDQGD